MRSFFIVAGVALTLAGASVSSSAKASEAAAAASMISAHRAAHGLAAVVADGRLNQAAEHQARASAQAGGLSHGDFAGRMRQFGIRGTSAENLAAGTPSLAGALAIWRSSPMHNSNLLMPGARRIGLGWADGGFHGRYWALVLGQ